MKIHHFANTILAMAVLMPVAGPASADLLDKVRTSVVVVEESARPNSSSTMTSDLVEAYCPTGYVALGGGCTCNLYADSSGNYYAQDVNTTNSGMLFAYTVFGPGGFCGCAVPYDAAYSSSKKGPAALMHINCVRGSARLKSSTDKAQGDKEATLNRLREQLERRRQEYIVNVEQKALSKN